MKIAILTYPLSYNYGCLLQAYALQEALKDLGHHVTIIDKRNWEADHWFGWCMRLVKNVIFHDIFRRRNRPSTLTLFLEGINNIRKVAENTDLFIVNRLNLTRKIYFFSFHKNELNRNFDAFVVGSDQVWRYRKNVNIRNYFLDFVKDDKIKISYAASFGLDIWEYNKKDTIKCSNLLQKFNAVSVREDSGVALCNEYLKVAAIHVIDPTLFYSKDFYLRLINLTDDFYGDNKLFVYVLDKTALKECVINRILSDFSLCLDDISSLPKAIYPGVESWIKGFHEASCVVTDSFHGCVFSIIFNKPFVVIANEERGLARINSLLKMFDLMDCLVKSDEEAVKIVSRMKKTEWIKIDTEILRKRKEALIFLQENL